MGSVSSSFPSLLTAGWRFSGLGGPLCCSRCESNCVEVFRTVADADVAGGAAALRDECRALRDDQSDDAVACCRALAAFRWEDLPPEEMVMLDRARTDSGDEGPSDDLASSLGDGGWVDLGLEHSEIKPFPPAGDRSRPRSSRKNYHAAANAVSTADRSLGGGSSVTAVSSVSSSSSSSRQV